MRRVLVGLLKVIAVAVFVVGAVLDVIANHTALTQELTCKGHWKDKEDAEVAHVQLTEYRWWSHLWTKSDGDVTAQTEKRAMASHIAFVQKIGNGSLALYMFKDGERGDTRGGYRVAHGEMTIKFTDSLVFVGTSCGPRETMSQMAAPMRPADQDQRGGDARSSSARDGAK